MTQKMSPVSYFCLTPSWKIFAAAAAEEGELKRARIDNNRCLDQDNFRLKANIAGATALTKL